MEPITTEITRTLAEGGLITIGLLVTIGAIGNMMIILDRIFKNFGFRVIRTQRLQRMVDLLNQSGYLPEQKAA